MVYSSRQESIKERVGLSFSQAILVSLAIATVVQDTSATGELVTETHSHDITAQSSDDNYTSCHHNHLLHTQGRLDTIAISMYMQSGCNWLVMCILGSSAICAKKIIFSIFVYIFKYYVYIRRLVFFECLEIGINPQKVASDAYLPTK